MEKEYSQGTIQQIKVKLFKRFIFTFNDKYTGRSVPKIIEKKNYNILMLDQRLALVLPAAPASNPQKGPHYEKYTCT